MKCDNHDSFKNCFVVIEHQKLESTQTQAKAIIDSGEAHDRSVVATSWQINGRAKSSRTWLSSKGDLACTIILKPSKALELQPQLTYIAAVAVSKVLSRYIPDHNIMHKWVNDILIDNFKVSGILLERYQEFILVGIGINLLAKRDVLEVQAIGVADLRERISYRSLLNSLLEEFAKLYLRWEMFGFTAVRAMWLEKALGIDKIIQISLQGVIKSGVFAGIDEIGNLQLASNGKIELICAGDVFL